MGFSFAKWFSVDVIQAILASAEVAVQRASPDYTIAHHVAATLAKLTGGPVISTPTARDAEPVGQAIIEAGEGVAAVVLPKVLGG
jgi:hypothetical protein